MADGGKLIIKIDGDSSDFKKVSNQLGKIGDIGFKAIKASAVAATGAIVAAGTAAIKSYADYEQLVGGVDTLFKESSQKLQAYAAQAYQTAGMSANAYMEKVTTFSASLLNSLGGNTSEAADIADMAMRDISDNANKMGTDLEMVSTVYSNLARGMYMTLDNLKLGFAGTKEGAMDMVNHAAQIDKSVKKNDISFGNLVKAIHAVQVEMGIYGTTSKEAATTISGSLNMVKASWQNLMTGIADPNQDFDKLAQEFVDSVVIFGKNLAPRIKIVLKGAVDLFKTLGPEISKAIQEMLPQALGSFGEVLSGILAFVTNNIQPIITTIYGLTTVFMSLKAISVVSTVISGVSTAITALGATASITSKVMAGLNVVMSANAFGAVAAAIGLVVGGIALLNAASDENITKTEELIIESEARIEKLNEEAEAYTNLKTAQEEQAIADMSQIANAKSLYNELTLLADANGYVDEKNRARAEFILGELNTALGTEYSMIDGQIQKYYELGASIEEIIQKKQAEILLDANKSVYAEALTNYTTAFNEQTQALATLTEAQEEYKNSLNGTPSQIARAQKALTEAQTAYDTAADTVAQCSKDISSYEAAMAASVEGDIEGVIKALDKSNNAYKTAAQISAEQSKLSKDQVAKNYQASVDAVKVALDNLVKNNNSANQQQYREALSFAANMRNAYIEVGGAISGGQAQGIGDNTYKIDAEMDSIIATIATYTAEHKSKGTDNGQGYVNGLNSKITEAYNAGYALAKAAIRGEKAGQKSNSPAKETIELGHDFGDGYVIGIEDKTKLAADTAKKTAERTVKALADGIKDNRSEVEKVMDEMNETLLESEQKYLEESERLKKSSLDSDKKYLEGLKETAEKERKIYEARQKDIENSKELIISSLEEMAEKALDSIEEVEELQADMSEKLKDYGDLYSTETRKIGSREYEIIKLEDISKQTDAIRKYADNLLTLKERENVPKEFFEMLRDMSVEEGAKFAEALLKADDTAFDKYIADWKEKQSEADRVSKILYSDEATEAQNEIKASWSKFGGDLREQGLQNASSWGAGFIAQLRVDIPKILNMINEAFGGIIDAPSYEAIGGTVNNFTTYTERAPVVVNGTIEVDGRELGRVVLDEGNREARRRGDVVGTIESE